MAISDLAPFVDVELSWRRTTSGQTAILRRPDEQAPWSEIARVDGSIYTARGIDPCRPSYFAAAGVLPDGGLVAEDEWEILRVAPLALEGRPERPATPSGLAVAQDGPNLNVRWDAAEEDRTASYELRQGATWEDALLIARDLRSTCYSYPWWASGSVTVWLAAVDRHGRPSFAKASATVTVAALDTHVTIGTTDEAGGGWAGTKTDTETSGGDLRISALPRPFGALTAPFGSYDDVGICARYRGSGTYETAVVNFGQVEPQRIEVNVAAEQPLDALPFGAMRMSVHGRRTQRDGTPVPLGTRSWCNRQAWTGAALLAPDVLVEIDTSQSSGGAWEGWRRWVPGTYTCWRVRLRVTLTGDTIRRLTLPTFTWKRRKYNHKDEGVVAVGAAPTPITFAAPFTAAPKVTVTMLGGSGILGPRIDVTAVTATGCNVQVFDDTNTSVAADVHWHALGV